MKRASGTVDTAEADLEVWLLNNPLLKEVLREQQAREDLQKAIDEGHAGIKTPTPGALRTLNEKLRAFAEEDSARVLVIEQMMTALRRDPFRPVAATSWRELNLLTPRVREMLAIRILEGSQVIPEEHANLTRAVDAAREDLRVAQEALAALGE